MSKIVYLEGSRAVGKTTLLKKIKQEHPEFVVIDGYARKEFMFDTTKFEDFIINEKLYLACDVAQHKVYKSLDTVIVVVKGPYTDVNYTETILREKFDGKDYHSTGIDEYIALAKQCTPDFIIYLDATKETILKRAEGDDHKRATMKIFMEQWLDDFADYYKNMQGTQIIDTNNLTPDEVYDKFLTLIGEDK